MFLCLKNLLARMPGLMDYKAEPFRKDASTVFFDGFCWDTSSVPFNSYFQPAITIE